MAHYEIIGHDDDECVCGCTRVAHYAGEGSCIMNFYHLHSRDFPDTCNRFQLYKRAAAIRASERGNG